jgi:NifB/MoaA-like Fe-S oxidoreductase
LPDYDFYEGFPQLENGVGMLRSLEWEFLDELDYTAPGAGTGERVTVVTGVAAAPFLKKLLLTAEEKCDKLSAQVRPIVNDFFGHTINVAGLITGRDLMAQLAGTELGQRVLIPQNMLRHGEGVFLDDVTTEQVRAALGVPLEVVPQDGAALLRAVLGER